MATDADLDLARVLFDGKQLDADVRERITSATLTRNLEGASTFELSVSDPERELLRRSSLFLERTVTNLDGRLFELVRVSKAGSELSCTFEDATVADLRRVRGVLSSKAGTTLDAFARRLLDGAPGVKLNAEGGRRSLDVLARGSEDDKSEDSWTALTRLAEERRWRVFADAGTVYFGSDEWLRRIGGKPHEVRENRDGIDSVDFDYDVGQPTVTATFTAHATRWAVRPGAPCTLHDLGVGSGLWLVQSASRSLFSTATTITVYRTEPALPEPKPEPRDDGGPTSAAKADAGGSVVTGPVSARGYSWPLSARVTSGYGQRGGRLHAGVDLAVPTGTPVRAARAGTVAFAGEAGGYGLAVYLDHGGGMVTRYAHLSKLGVRRGQAVKLGEQLGASGNTGSSTGPHLHFEVRVNGTAKNPLDYLPPKR